MSHTCYNNRDIGHRCLYTFAFQISMNVQVWALAVRCVQTPLAAFSAAVRTDTCNGGRDVVGLQVSVCVCVCVLQAI